MPSCQIKDEALRAFVENSIGGAEDKEILDHLQECEDCQSRLKLIFEQGPVSCFSAEELSRLKTQISMLVNKAELHRKQRQLGWELIARIVHADPLSVLAAAADQTADDKLARLASETASLFFIAMCEKGETGYWRAEFPLPVEVSPETQLTIRVCNDRDRPVEGGTFIFCGIAREVKEGRVRYAMQELQQNLKKQMVSFAYPGAEPVSGVLELFGEDEE